MSNWEGSSDSQMVLSGMSILTDQLRRLPPCYWSHFGWFKKKKEGITPQINCNSTFGLLEKSSQWDKSCVGIGLRIIETFRGRQRLNKGAEISLVLLSWLLHLFHCGESVETRRSMEISETLSLNDSWYHPGREHDIKYLQGCSGDRRMQRLFFNMCACMWMQGHVMMPDQGLSFPHSPAKVSRSLNILSLLLGLGSPGQVWVWFSPKVVLGCMVKCKHEWNQHFLNQNHILRGRER